MLPSHRPNMFPIASSRTKSPTSFIAPFTYLTDKVGSIDFYWTVVQQILHWKPTWSYEWPLQVSCT
jgi:hypothetical protein